METWHELFICHQSGFELPLLNPILPVDTPEEVITIYEVALKFKKSGNLSKALDFDKIANRGGVIM